MGEVEKKYELTSDIIEVNGVKLSRIKALRDFADVKAGDLGGRIEKEENLSQDGDCWVGGDACVRRNARVNGNALVWENAIVYGHARVSGDALVDGNAIVWGNAEVSGHARVSGDALVSGYARVSGDALVDGNANVCGGAQVNENADYATVSGFGSEHLTTTFYRQKRGTIGVQCGCFNGNLTEFREQVKKTHGDTKFAKEYLMIADLMELHFSGKSNKNENRREAMNGKLKMICRECQYMKVEIAKVGRSSFYCMHPEAKTECMPHRRIAQSREKDIPVKSMPRWCPLKQSMKEKDK